MCVHFSAHLRFQLIFSGFVNNIFCFLLKRHITWQAASQVFAFFRCSQSTEKCFQIVFHISLYHLTTLNRKKMNAFLQIFHFLYCKHFSSSSLSYASSARSSCLTIQRLHIPTHIIAGHSPIAYFNAFFNIWTQYSVSHLYFSMYW